MRAPLTSALILLLIALTMGQRFLGTDASSKQPESPLERRVAHFELADGILRDGIAKLSTLEGLHLGMEEVLRDNIREDPKASSPHLSLKLENRTMREILDQLCRSDPRYTWSTDGETINIYPRSSAADPKYLLNLNMGRIVLDAVPDPDQGLTPLSKKFPEQQIGYIQMGGTNAYSEPWTVTLEHVTVRQFVNRIAEHMGPQTSWIWQGDTRERMFTFARGGFGTSNAAESK